MADAKPTPAQLCGQLYATLEALCAIGTGTGNSKLAELQPRVEVQRSPSKKIPGLLQEAAEHLLRARARGRDHVKAADELFRSIPDFLPANGRHLHSLDAAQVTQFREGYHQQMVKYAPTHTLQK
ncbi:hypothetical protein ACIQ7Q_13010 [Streptomyces sp. NPDC096176]|uniref:hypothetical protein n=1 Tax=Streptomyces sp. NPDC096176 TaxID=3366079 RepID=UPI0037F36E39